MFDRSEYFLAGYVEKKPFTDFFCQLFFFLFHLLRLYLFFLQVIVPMVNSGEVCFLDCVTR